MIIIETSLFTKQLQKLLTDEEYRHLQNEIATRPYMGAIVSKSGGVRKMRWGYRGKGKRGGVRVIYYWAVTQNQILMLMVYPKNVQDNLSPTQLKLIRQIVEDEYL